MWSQFPSWFLLAGVLLGCGCVATLFFLVRDSDRRLRGFGQQSDLMLKEHDQAYGQLEGRVEDLAERLANAASDRRDLSRSNQKLSADLGNWEGELHAARSSLTAQEGELTRLREQHHEVSERFRGQRAKLEESLSTISALQADLAGKSRQLDALDRQRGEIEEHHRRELAEMKLRAQRQSEVQGELSARVAELETTLGGRDRALQQGAAEAKAAAQERAELATRVEQQAGELHGLCQREQELEAAHSARVGELERELARREQHLRDRAAALESLQRAATEQDLRTGGLHERCGELERQLASQAEEALGQARAAREAERNLSARVSELEADLGRRELVLRERATALEARQGEIASRDRELGAALELCRELERQVELDQERARGSREAESAFLLRVTELEGDLSKRDDELREHSTTTAMLAGDLASRSRELESVEERCRGLGLELRRLQDEEREQRRITVEVEASHADRVRELEAALQARDGELDRLRSARTLLADECAAVSDELEASRQELRDRDQRLAESEGRVETSRLEVQRNQEASEQERALIDPLVEGRILPLFRRRSVQGPDFLPDSYLAGLEQGDLDLALRSLLGGVEPLSPSSMASLGSRWRQEHAAWSCAPIDRQVVYLWADGIFVKAGLGGDGQALLVAYAAFVDGSRSVVAVEPGDRESKDDWLAILRSLERRGMGVPRLVVADETLGLLDALDELGWSCARQRCWGRRTVEVLSGLPKARQPWATEMLRRITTAETRADAKELRDAFVKRCGVRHAQIGERLCADWRQMTSYFSFPKSHWPHLRTTNVVESPFVTIRLQSGASRPGPATPDAGAMLWKLLVAAETTFRKVNSPLMLPEVARGDAFVDGLPDERARIRAA